MNLDTVVCADALDFLRTLPDESVNCLITSPPYYGLRDYGEDGQLGLEDTPAEYVARMVAIFREARRVLRDDGTCWIVIGDSYWGGKGQSGHADPEMQMVRVASGVSFNAPAAHVGGHGQTRPTDRKHETLKPKDLIGIPWRVALALQADGWYLRSDIIWSKPNPMPESVRDRPTKAHEYVFLLTRSATYWYDADAVAEVSGSNSHGGGQAHDSRYMQQSGRNDGNRTMGIVTPTRNRRSVWTVSTEPTPFAHFATFPQKLIEPMVLAGCPARVCATCGAPWERMVERGFTAHDGKTESAHEKGSSAHRLALLRQAARERGGEYVNERKTVGWEPTCSCQADISPGVVCDPFMGSGTTALVARRLGRHYVGCDVNPEYVALANERLAVPYTLPMFV